MNKKSSAKKIVVSIIISAISIFLLYTFLFKAKEKSITDNIVLEKVSIRDVVKTVTANGTINPVNTVSVGTQVSGTIEKIYVDYNSKVKKGQILAELDKRILEKNVEEANSVLKQAKFDLDYTTLDTKRTRELYKNNYIAKVELDKVETALLTSKEQYKIAKAKYDIAKRNLGYTIITSPVSGVVISRDVDVGQTVAASLSAPTLFMIAEDLSKMQIETNISEADIGMIKVGQEAIFTVDAYPTLDFKGKIKEIRLNPATNSNVVSYSVIISLDNKDQMILPGMTAFVTINIKETKDALVVPNTVLRFRPNEDIVKMLNLETPKRDARTTSVIYLVKGTNIKAVVVKRGLSDGRYTEIITDELKEGDSVISEVLSKKR